MEGLFVEFGMAQFGMAQFGMARFFFRSFQAVVISYFK